MRMRVNVRVRSGALRLTALLEPSHRLVRVRASTRLRARRSLAGGALRRPSARSESIRAAAAAGAARTRAAGVTATREATDLRPWLTPSLAPWPSCEAKG